MRRVVVLAICAVVSCGTIAPDPCATAALGDPCSAQGTSCVFDAGPCSGLVCDGTEWVGGLGVQGASCTQAGLVCRMSGTECDTCACDGARFQCTQHNCVPNDASVD